MRSPETEVLAAASPSEGDTAALNPFARVIGDGWRFLDEQLRTFYLSSQSITGAGRFRVKLGTTPLHRLVGRVLGLPAAGERVTVRTEIRRNGAEESWTTWFNGVPMAAMKRTDGRHLLEAVGPFVLAFSLAPWMGGIDFVHEATYVAWRWRRVLRLPRRVAPRAGARTTGGSQASSLEVAVWVDAPFLGRVLEYAGTLWIVDPAETIGRLDDRA